MFKSHKFTYSSMEIAELDTQTQVPTIYEMEHPCSSILNKGYVPRYIIPSESHTT